MGMKERGGNVRTVIIPNVKMATLRNVVLSNVKEGSVVSTDEFVSYGLLEGDGYKHGTVRHRIKNWKYYDRRTGETHSTNGIESFWTLFKRSLKSTHIHVSSKHMQSYLDEFTFRSNHREMQNAMFDLLVSRI